MCTVNKNPVLYLYAASLPCLPDRITCTTYAVGPYHSNFLTFLTAMVPGHLPPLMAWSLPRWVSFAGPPIYQELGGAQACKQCLSKMHGPLDQRTYIKYINMVRYSAHRRDGPNTSPLLNIHASDTPGLRWLYKAIQDSPYTFLGGGSKLRNLS